MENRFKKGSDAMSSEEDDYDEDQDYDEDDGM